MSAPRIMVDELCVYAGAEGPFCGGSCHLTVDGDSPEAIDALHAFAARIGMRREWFQRHVITPHYDLTPGRRARALALGAEVVPAREQAILRRARREATRREVLP